MGRLDNFRTRGRNKGNSTDSVGIVNDLVKFIDTETVTHIQEFIKLLRNC